MPHQHITIPVTLATHLTLEIVDPRVRRQVFFQVIPHGEPLPAKFTLMRVDSLVLIHVVAITLFGGEPATAQFTLVGSQLSRWPDR